MFGNMLKHIFIINKSNCITFELVKRHFSGSDQMPLNTLVHVRAAALINVFRMPARTGRPSQLGIRIANFCIF